MNTKNTKYTAWDYQQGDSEDTIHIKYKGRTVATTENAVAAKNLTRYANSHEGLVEALKGLTKWLDDTGAYSNNPHVAILKSKAIGALKLAEEES